jgi:hypothetical protein
MPFIFKRPFIIPYFAILIFISIISIYYYITHLQIISSETINPIVATYFVIKAFLIFANSTLPLKFFRFNPIIYRTILSLMIGLIFVFIKLDLFFDPILILIDCALCLISVFSLLKMHQNKNAKPNYL